MARRTKRRPRVVWLPPSAENRAQPINPAISDLSVGSFAETLEVFGLFGAQTTGIIAMVSDLSAPPFQSGNVPVSTLADVYSSGYRLRRIVGKLFVSQRQSNAANGNVPQVLVTAGLIVLRTDETGVPLAGVAAFDTYSPAIIQNWADPWIWRRSWMFSDFNEAIALDLALFPDTNAQYGSVMDGPHVDAKTARRIGLEERLFLVTTVQVAASGSSGAPAHAVVDIHGELRFVGSILNMAGNRRNASR